MRIPLKLDSPDESKGSRPVLRGTAGETPAVYSPLCQAAAWLRVPGGDYRLVLASCAGLADQQQHGGDVLRRLS